MRINSAEKQIRFLWNWVCFKGQLIGYLQILIGYWSNSYG